jgi:hypothetical protein
MSAWRFGYEDPDGTRMARKIKLYVAECYIPPSLALQRTSMHGNRFEHACSMHTTSLRQRAGDAHQHIGILEV